MSTPTAPEALAPPKGFSHWAIVRLVVLVAALLAALIGPKFLINPLIPRAGSPMHHIILLVSNLGSAILLLIVYALVVRWLEHRRASEVDPVKGAGGLVVGLGLGVLLIGAVNLILWGLGRAVFAPGAPLQSLGGDLAACFAAAVLEELLLRAVLFRIVEQVSGTTVAVIVSAIVFGLLHALNPGATPISTGAIALEAGVLLAVAYALTRNLWFAIGIHAGWNFGEGSLFGAPVSGGAAAHSFLKATLTGPDLLTGGAFGPEASIPALCVCLTAALVIGVLVIRRAEWRPWSFRLSLP